MKRLAFGLCFVIAAASLGNAGCDDDDGPATVTGDAAVDGTAGAAMCVATFAAYNRPGLGALTAPTGKCAAAADLDVICANDVGGVARTCGSACFQSGGTQDCTSACVKQTINPSVSEPCLSCYSAALKCTIENCVEACVANSSSPSCVACQQQKGCLALFYSCSGLPAPGLGADAGVDAAADAAVGN